MNSINTEAIKDRVSAVDVCRHYGIDLDRAGFTRCPFHGEKTASMKVYDGRRGYYCFGCHRGGDVINFTQAYFGLSFVDAAKKLNADFGLGLDLEPKKRETGRAALAAAKARYKEQKPIREAQQAREEAHKALWNAWGDAVAEYIRLFHLTQEAKAARFWDDLTDDMCYALRNIDAAAYNLTYAETMLRSFESNS